MGLRLVLGFTFRAGSRFRVIDSVSVQDLYQNQKNNFQIVDTKLLLLRRRDSLSDGGPRVSAFHPQIRGLLDFEDEKRDSLGLIHFLLSSATSNRRRKDETKMREKSTKGQLSSRVL